jgi:hypothetical protein
MVPMQLSPKNALNLKRNGQGNYNFAELIIIDENLTSKKQRLKKQ